MSGLDELLDGYYPPSVAKITANPHETLRSHRVNDCLVLLVIKGDQIYRHPYGTREDAAHPLYIEPDARCTAICHRVQIRDTRHFIVRKRPRDQTW
jgi:hypothetical protein